jgi:nucleoside-diphosphate-sugar epimerase
MNILITGITSSIGDCLIDKLYSSNHNIFCIVRGSIDYAIYNIPEKHIYNADLLDYDSLLQIPGQYDIIIHIASRTEFAPIPDTHLYNFNDNILMTKNIAERAKAWKVKQFIFISSTSSMGDRYEGIRNENSPCKPDSPYGESKLLSEKLLHEYESEFTVTILRPTLIYGSFNRGAFHRLIRAFDKKFIFFPGDGSNKKCPVCVHNVINAIKLSIDNPKAYNQTFIVTDSKSYTTKEMLVTLNKIMGNKSVIIFLPNIFIKIIELLLGLLKIFKIKALSNLIYSMKKARYSNIYDINKICSELKYTSVCSLENCLSKYSL